MGLDSVELLVALEKRFHIAIPDAEAERIGTVADIVASICWHLRIVTTQERSAIFLETINSVIRYFAERKLTAPILAEHTMLTSLWPIGHATTELQQLADYLDLKVPDVPTSWHRIGKWLFGQAVLEKPLWPGKTLTDLVDWIIALNHAQLLPVVACRYDVERVVIGITSDMIGVPVPEIQLQDSFTNDLGVD